MGKLNRRKFFEYCWMCAFIRKAITVGKGEKLCPRLGKRISPNDPRCNHFSMHHSFYCQHRESWGLIEMCQYIRKRKFRGINMRPDINILSDEHFGLCYKECRVGCTRGVALDIYCAKKGIPRPPKISPVEILVEDPEPEIVEIKLKRRDKKNGKVNRNKPDQKEGGVRLLKRRHHR